MIPQKNIGKQWLLLPLFIILSFSLYYLTINRSFSSDDFLVLRRVGLDRKLFIKGFFRPLSDLTLYVNYLLGGFNPTGYYLFSILLHGINSFFLFLFCRQWVWTDDRALQNRYAFLSGIFFLCYPFHNECIVWVLGRASGIAGTFGILSLSLLVSNLSEKAKIPLVCLCYFIGMTAYESIMMMPLLIMVILYKRNTSLSKYTAWIMAMAFTLLLHLIIRVEISGVLTGSYGEGFLKQQISRYAANLFKVSARLFLPPIQNSLAFILLSVAVLAAFLTLVLIIFRRRKFNREYLLKTIIILSMTCVIPVLSGVSTKTSESDRFLYFPSFFFCSCISLILVHLITELRTFTLAVILICAYNIFFLEKNNSNWKKASAITKNIIRVIGSQKNLKKTYLINLPDEYNGAYIFRLGLKEALVMHQIDTSGLIIVNHLLREQMLALQPVIPTPRRDGEISIPPMVTIKPVGSGPDTIWRTGNHIYLAPGKENTVLYWNNQELIKLQYK